MADPPTTVHGDVLEPGLNAQVVNEGRHQGGRAPYGYVVVDGGPHPNPRKTAEGYRLRVLVIDEEAAEVVRRIFAEYADGKGDRAIANGLNRDGIPCPSAHRPDQNRHRLADGWQGSTVRSILENPRYTGYAVFGRWSKHEVLLDPDDVAAGHVVRFRRSQPERVVRSRRPAHPAIVSVEVFVEVQLLRRSRAAGGLESRRKLERGPKAKTKRPYPLRGRVRCGYCGRRMEGTPRAARTYYRCSTRTLVPGSPLLADHPKNVYLPEAAVLDPLNDWLNGLFARENRDATVRALLDANADRPEVDRVGRAKRRADEAATRLRRLQRAIEAGAEPEALVDAINRAKEERDAALIELDRVPVTRTSSRAEVDALLDHLSVLGRSLRHAAPEDLQRFYEELRLDMIFVAEERAVDVTIRPARRDSERVRGGT
ncbi:MAG TPA: recombinase family protein [Pseudonocardiaceae bacterium]